jgi:hypothetical protein
MESFLLCGYFCVSGAPRQQYHIIMTKGLKHVTRSLTQKTEEKHPDMNPAMTMAAVTAVLFWACSSSVYAAIPRHIGSIELEEAAFVSLVPSAKAQNLVVTQFSANPLRGGVVFYVSDIGKDLANLSSVKPKKIVAEGLKWPNEVTPVPRDGNAVKTGLAHGGFILGDGFLVPFKSTGSITYVEPKFEKLSKSIDGAVGRGNLEGDFSTERLTAEKSDWFYHLGLFLDVDQDGWLDVVTARATAPQFGAKRGQLIWLRNPGLPMQFPWEEHLIVEGPDVSFDIVPLNGSSTPALVYSAEFFGKKLTVLNLGKGGAVTASQTIDDDIGEVYDVKATTLYSNGADAGSLPAQLVVTNYSYESQGALMIYEIPESHPVGGQYERTTVFGQFKNRQYMPGSGAPGFVAPHTPRTDSAKTPKNIFVCGDGAEELFLFTPANGTTPAATRLSGGPDYTLAQAIKYGATVGGITVGDADGDGWNEVFVCVYDTGLIDVFTYRP